MSRKLLLLASLFTVMLIPNVKAICSSCSMTGYDFCWGCAESGANAYIGESIYSPPNNIRWTTIGGVNSPYVLLSDGGYKFMYSCVATGTATAYYGTTSCDYNGCYGGTQLSPLAGTYTAVTSLTNQVCLGTVLCKSTTASYSSWAYWNPFCPYYTNPTRYIRILNCGKDSDCASGTTCITTSGDPTQWYCLGQCANTDISCGIYPSCSNCNANDGYVGSNFCYDNDVYRTYRDYYCSANSCTYTDANTKITECGTLGCNPATNSCVTGTISGELTLVFIGLMGSLSIIGIVAVALLV